MVYQKILFKQQDLESDIVIEFLDKKESPVEVKPKSQSNVYKLSKPLTKKQLRSDRKMRKNKIIKFNRPANTFAPAERRISY